MRIVSFEEQTNSFFLKIAEGFYISEEMKKSIRNVIGEVYCPCANEKGVFFQTKNRPVSTTVKLARLALKC